jgi:Ca2+-binding RTX toxin-like protein
VRTTLGAYTLAPNVENVTFIGTGDFAGTGNALWNSLTGGDGDDTLDGGAGGDVLAGGAGNDTYVVDNAADAVIEFAGGGTDTVRTKLSVYGLADGVENLVFTGAAGFSGIGNALDNSITGGAGKDTLDGGAGADTLAGGAGHDTYVVDHAGDIVLEAAGGGIDTVHSTLATYMLHDNVENLVLAGGGGAAGIGNALANRITGGSGNDTLHGVAGNDVLDGGAGADLMFGGSGHDTYVADSLGDAVIENANEGRDTVQTTLLTYTLGANVENLTFIGSGDFSGTGNAAANRIAGGGGNDTLAGGGGNDVFVFAADFGNDRVEGFDADAAGGQDLLDISQLGITQASFDAAVTVTSAGSDTLIEIGAQSILLAGVSNPGVITANDFVLAV